MRLLRVVKLKLYFKYRRCFYVDKNRNFSCILKRDKVNRRSRKVTTEGKNHRWSNVGKSEFFNRNTYIDKYI